MDTQLYSPEETAKRLDIHVKTLLGLADERKITYVLVGKRKKFTPSDISSFINSCRDAAMKADPSKPSKKKKNANVVDLRDLKKRKRG